MKYILFIFIFMSLSIQAQVSIKIDATADKKAISPYLYGRNNSLSTDPGQVLNINWTMLKDAGITFFRESGGNNCTKYNWRKKLSSHPDWYNNVYGNDWDVAAKALKTYIPSAQGMWAFQLLGKVAKTNKANFPDWDYNKSQWWEGVNQNLAGNGVLNPTGSKAKVEGNINQYLEDWSADSTVAILDHWFKDLALDKNKLLYWNMDNEVEIWNGTHDDVMPVQISAEEFMQKYFEVAKKARAKFPNIKLVGPVTANEWQWYNWSNGITVNGKSSPWLEYFIKRVAEEQKSSGIKLLDVLDIHYYPGSNKVDEVLQYHRVFFDRNYVYPEANGVKTINGGYDNSQNKEYIFGRVNDWLEKYLGTNHGVKLGVTESGINITDPNAIAIWYASTLGEFMKNEVEIFTPWSWPVGMWETVHLFSRYNQSFSIKSTSSDETLVSAYPSINATQDSMTVVLVNRSSSGSKTTSLSFDNFVLSGKTATTLALKSLPNTETFVSHTQNALSKSNVAIENNTISLTLPAMSITSIQLSGKLGQYVAVLGTSTELESIIKVFPNPFTNEFKVDTGVEKFKQIELIDETGKQIYTQFIPNGETVISVNQKVKPGTYFLKLSSEKAMIVKKIVAL